MLQAHSLPRAQFSTSHPSPPVLLSPPLLRSKQPVSNSHISNAAPWSQARTGRKAERTRTRAFDREEGSTGIPSSASGASAESGEDMLKEATEAMTTFLNLLKVDAEVASEEQPLHSGELLEFVPDRALDAAIAARKATGEEGVSPLTFQDIIELVATYSDPAKELGLVFDSMTHRLLVLSTPVTTTPLSSMLVCPGKSVHRYLVEGVCGEEAILTFVLEYQDTLQAQYRSAPRISKVWRLQSATGEPALEGLPTSPTPEAGPELVVQAQLEALKANDIERVWEFAAPANKAVTGPLERFQQLFAAPQFRPLIGFDHCDVLKRCMHTEDAYFELVAVTSRNTGLEGKAVSLIYLWDVRRQGPSRVGTWMTEGVQVISATRVTRWPGTEDT